LQQFIELAYVGDPFTAGNYPPEFVQLVRFLFGLDEFGAPGIGGNGRPPSDNGNGLPPVDNGGGGGGSPFGDTSGGGTSPFGQFG